MSLLENCCLCDSACLISVWLHVKEEFHAFPASWKRQVKENLGSWSPVHRGMMNAACRFATPSLHKRRQWPTFILSHWSEVSVSPDVCKCFCFGMSGLQCLGLRSISINFSREKNIFTKNIQFGTNMVQELSKKQQDYFSQLSPFKHLQNIKLRFSWREKYCFMLILTIKKGKALQCEN